MEQGSNKIVTIAIAIFMLGLGLYLNRKKINAIFSRRVTKISKNDSVFMAALAKECRRR